jgi:PAS domain S-box-containing protein
MPLLPIRSYCYGDDGSYFSGEQNMNHATTCPIQLLILEDNVADAQLAVRKLKVSGIDVKASVAQSATEFMRELNSTEFDIILCDFTLPGWSGLDALRWVRESGYELPFIYVSGTLGEEIAVESIKLGATDYVLKNNLERLPLAVRRALDEHDLHRQRKHIERELHESEEQYRLLFDSNPQPMWVFDRNTLRFLAVNDAAIRHYGYSRQEFMQMTILDIRPKEDVVPLLRSALKSPGQGLQEPQLWRHRLKDGRTIDVEITSHGLMFHGREAELILAHDVTEARQNQEMLRQSEERFAKAFHSSPLPITISTLAEGRYVDANEAFLRMIGCTRQELVGQTARELNIWAFPEDRGRMIEELQRGGRVSGLETIFNSKTSGARSVQLFIERMQLDGVSCVLAISYDITDSKRLEEQFRQAQKMEAMGRLAGGVAHDFNNMLGIILGYCDLAEGGSLEGSIRRDVDQIKRAANRAADLIRQMLAFSRQQIVRPSVVNLNAIVTEVGHMLHRVLPSNIQLIFKPASSLGSIKADLGQLEQILVNLVVNSRDAMPEGGKIVIETKDIDLDQFSLNQQAAVKPGPYVLLCVEDTGCGMSQETLSRIFEPFYTTKPLGKGSGLGLAMVYGAVQENHGYITVKSEISIGTKIVLYFPRVNDTAEPLLTVAPAVTTIAGTECVLVVEDEPVVRGLIVKMLESEGYHVLDVSDGQAAIIVSKEYVGIIDVLLTDIMLPGMNGGELAQDLLQSRPNLKVLYISGYAGGVITSQRLLEDSATIVEKPFTKRSLLRKLRELIDRERPS